MKLLRVVANRFKLCEDNFTINFIPTANKTVDDKEFELHEIDDGLFVFTTLGIIGKNASGKTMTMQLLSVVYDILSNYKIASNVFRYDDCVDVNLDILFYHNGFLYRYVTDLSEADGTLSNRIIFNNQKLYRRKYKKAYAKKLLEYDQYEEMTWNNILPLPEDISIVYFLTQKYNPTVIYFSSDDELNKNYRNMFSIYKLIDIKNDLKLIESILKIFDEHILSISVIDEKRFKLKFSDKSSKEVSDEELYSILSSGTTKGFHLFSYVVSSLLLGSDLLIDEIENHFHKSLVEYLINLYKDKSVNKNNASLIFTTHYCELLDLFNRTDNIYISKFDKKIKLENMYENYKFRPELSKSKKFYENAFDTNVNYEALMQFKRGIIEWLKH